jgi:hypothetical protein
MLTVDRTRRAMALVVSGVLLVVLPGPAAQVASAQCADPRGNSYCSNNGQVTFNPPPGSSQTSAQPCADPRGNAYCQNGGQATSAQPQAQPQPASQPASANGPASSNPALQPNAPQSASASISLDPPSAPAGASVTVSAQGLGPNRSAWVNLAQMKSTTGLNLGAQQLATVTTAADGSLSTSVTIPAVPSWTAGTASICLINATAQPVCAPFTLASADQAAVNTATTPDAIVGHYQCSSMTLIGFGGGFCTGTEPVLALNGDGSYSWGDEQGNWTFDGSTVSFDGGLGSASVLNRRLTIDTQVDAPDGSGQQAVRYIYIRMDY